MLEMAYLKLGVKSCMDFELKCSGCNKVFKLPIEKLPIKARSATCRVCKTGMTIPSRSEVDAVVDRSDDAQEPKVIDRAKPNSVGLVGDSKSFSSKFQIGFGAIAIIWGLVIIIRFAMDYLDDSIVQPPSELLSATLIARPNVDDFGGVSLSTFLEQFYSKVWPTGLKASNSSWSQNENVYTLEFTVRADGVREEFVFEHLLNQGAANVVLFRHPTAQNWMENINIATNILMGNKTEFDLKREYYERAEKRQMEQSNGG